MRFHDGRRKATTLLTWTLILGLLATAWFTGMIGMLIVRYVLPALVPWNIGKEVQITAVTCGAPPPVCVRGVALTVSRERSERIAREVLGGWWRLVPPGLIREGMSVSGTWSPQKTKLPGNGIMPLEITVDSSVGEHPVLIGRYPGEEMNEFMKDCVEVNNRRTEEWAFGKYTTSYRIIFETLHFFTDEPIPDPPVDKRVLRYEATGKVKFKFEDGFLDLGATAKVKDFRGFIEARFNRNPKGVTLTYDFNIDSFEGNVRNLPGWGDEKISKDLRKSLMRSFNREKRKDKIAKIRVPEWVPLDVKVDIQLTK